MAFRRIRLQSFAPLPLLRVWFLIPQDVVDVQSLKCAISTLLSPLKELDIRPAQLVLEMDDFELLDDCSIDLVHEGDILIIKPRDPAVLDRLKRKATVEKDIRNPKRRRLLISSQDSSIVSSSTSGSSSTDSSDSTPNSTDSSDSASSSTPSDSDSAESNSSLAQKALVLSNNQDTRPNGAPSRLQSRVTSRVRTIQQSNVPPGFGKPSTHSRNKRRKLKRKYAAARITSRNGQSACLAELTREELPSISHDDVLQPSMQPSVQPPPATVSIAPNSSRGKSPKGISSRKGMEGSPVPQKFIFDSSFVATTSPTFIPPSEREDLPKNLLVTSVEIDWRRNQGRSSRHDVNVDAETLAREDTHGAEVSDPNIIHCIDWTAIETAWDKHKTLDASVELSPDTILGWKAFGLDPVSLTPQAAMLHLGQVVSVDVGTVLVQPLTRPNTGRASFGRVSMGDQEELADQILKPLEEVWSNKWKLISHK